MSRPPHPSQHGIGRYWVVQWSGGGGFGHYAWLLADALAPHLARAVPHAASARVERD